MNGASKKAVYGIAVALVATVAILPVSRWVLRNHIDVLTGGWWGQGQWSDTQIYPQRVLDQNAFKPEFQVSPSGRQDDPAALAFAYKKALHAQALVSFTPIADRTQAIERNHRDIIESARRGTLADPDNAFFWAMLANGYDIAGEPSKRDQALMRAAALNRFESFSMRERSERYNDFLNRAGYRGERAREAIVSAMSLPHLGPLTALALSLRTAPSSRATTQAQADLLRLADTIQRTSDISIEVVVARNMQRRTLTPSVTVKGMQENNALVKFVPAFLHREEHLKIPRPYDPTASIKASDRMMSEFWSIADDTDSYLKTHGFWQVAVAPLALLACALATLTAFLVAKTRGGDTGRKAAPFLLAAAGFWFAGVHGVHEGLTAEYFTDFGLAAGMAIGGTLQFSRRLSRYGFMLGGILCIGAIFAAYAMPLTSLPVLAFIVAFAGTKVTGNSPTLLAGLGLVLLSGGTAALWLVVVLQGPNNVWLASILAACLVAFYVLMAARSSKVVSVAPAVVLVLAAGYVLGVAFELRQNSVIRASIDGWETQADLMRAKAGIGRNTL